MRMLLLLPCLLLVACDSAPPPAPSAAPADRTSAEHRRLRDAIQKPIDRAKAAEAINLKAAEEQRKAIEDAGG